ncbi:Sigma54 specific transcriptional regulator, Fis family [Candidatus Sulfopaludibacter sp. SbA3]|nr:Sigma54 specific transcriptional regulator, Fis family [Candidatus Sulfopaludibacter sp. SbA3]
MASLSPAQRALLQAVSELAYCNPFLPERVVLERAVLGAEFHEGEPVWSQSVEDPERPRENVWRIAAKLEPLVEQARGHLQEQDPPLYEDAVLHLLYQRYYPKFFEAGFGAQSGKPGRWRFYQEFVADWNHFGLPAAHDPSHIFACFRQIQRAFEQVFRDIIGSSMPAARLRASIWQSIFTHDMRRYRRTLYARMGEFATLITGPSGTGKELVAREIAQSRYVPFDVQRLSFADDGAGSFFPINISALSPTLVESELFGHRRGAFTGAVGDRKGWLEMCPELGSVFLDELGDLDPAIQVKLLRVIETRTFHPVGDTAARQFRGKLITATNRDLGASMKKGLFREDLYYRLCSDQVVTPSLAAQLSDSPGVLRELVFYMSRRVAGAEAEELAPEVMDWITGNLGSDYAWPGNYRELEQCVKNVLIRRNYRPSDSAAADPIEALAGDLRAGRLTADELLARYVTLVYSRTGSYEETARRLGLDRRTVKAKVDTALLESYRGL